MSLHNLQMEQDPRKGNPFYYDLDAHPLDDLDFYRKHGANRSILELGCGTGRVLAPLSHICQRIVGIDYSPDMVSACRDRLSQSGIPARATVQVGDITQLDLGETFDLAIAPFRVMQALVSDAEVSGFFSSIRRHLTKGGRAIINAFHPNRPPEAIRESWKGPDEIPRWEKAVNGFRITHAEIRDTITEEPLVLHPKLIYRKYRGEELVEEFVLKIRMRCYYPDEYLALAKAHGFQVLEKWGGYHGEPYGGGKELVLVLKP